MGNRNHDIEKYLRGEMSPRERYELEKQALNDPFLADAIDGAEMVKGEDFEKDVKSLNKKILGNSPTKYFWPLGIAASVLLIVAVYFYMPSAEENVSGTGQLALNDSKDSQPLASEDSVYDKKNETTQNLLSERIKAPETVGRAKAGKSATATQPVAESKPTEDTSIATGELVQEEPVEQSTEFITEAEQETAPSPAARDEVKIQSFSEQKKESRRLRSEALKSVNPSVVSGAGAEKSDSDDRSEKNPTPSIGESAYQIYLKTNLKYPADAIANNIEGEVVVNFTVKRNGEPDKFKIEKSIGHGCDEELIRLIKEGPRWTPISNEGRPVDGTARVAFTFNLPE